MEKIKVSDYIINFFLEKGISDFFVVSGAGNVHLLESIRLNPKCKITCFHHEQSAAIAATGYYKATGKIAPVFVTMGGGTTNTITGVLNGWFDSVPMFIVSGQEPSKNIKYFNDQRTIGVQGFDIASMVGGITKRSALLDCANAIQEIMSSLFESAHSQRPGPVWLDIPIDLLGAYVRERESDIRSAILKELTSSSKPIFIVGNGVKDESAERLLHLLHEKTNIPLLTSWNAKNKISDYDDLNFGHFGTYGERAANHIIQRSDFILSLGCRLPQTMTGYDLSLFAPKAEKIIVDIDNGELKKFLDEEAFAVFCEDANNVINDLEIILQNHSYDFSNWIKECENIHERFPTIEKGTHDEVDGCINSYRFIQKLSTFFSDDEFVIADMGTALTCTFQALDLSKGQKIITSAGLGEMGYAIPSSIGVCKGRPGRVVVITGDGSIMMNLQELETIVYHKLPVKIFLYSNDGYLTIRNTQKTMFGDGDHLASGEGGGVSCPNYENIAKAFNISSFKIDKMEEIESVVKEMFSNNSPCLCVVKLNPNQLCVPKFATKIDKDGNFVPSGIDNMYPPFEGI